MAELSRRAPLAKRPSASVGRALAAALAEAGLAARCAGARASRSFYLGALAGRSSSLRSGRSTLSPRAVIRTWTLDNFADLSGTTRRICRGSRGERSASPRRSRSPTRCSPSRWRTSWRAPGDTSVARSASSSLVLLPLWSSYLVRIYAWRTDPRATTAPLNWFAERGIGLPDTDLAYTNTAMWIVFSYVWLPFMVLPVYAALERIPRSLPRGLARPRRAAARGRCGRVILPLALPGLVAGSIFTFSLTLGDYITPRARRRRQARASSATSSTTTVGQRQQPRSQPRSRPCRSSMMGIYLAIARRLGAFEAL